MALVYEGITSDSNPEKPTVHVTFDRSNGVKPPELTDEQIKHLLEPLKDGYGKSKD